MADWLDFNNATDPEPATIDIASIKQQLLERLPQALAYLFPAGKVRGHQFFIGDVSGKKGKSLVVELEGADAGLWLDFSTQEKGDIIGLWAAVHDINEQTQFPRIIKDIQQWLGHPQSHTKTPVVSQYSSMDDLGKPTAKWDYRDAFGHLIACVYRYDTPEGKEFRPWDVKAKKKQAPTPRPLYNQPQVAQAQEVILVEGEKAADALIKTGIVATTAMNGANAPIDKTDWQPLQNKHVLIWPDHDEAGVQYAEQVALAIGQLASSVSIMGIPADKAPKWDAADAIDEQLDIAEFIRQCHIQVISRQSALSLFSLNEFLADDSPMPEDLIAPRVVTPRGMVVFGGAPKVGKSDFLLAWLTHMAGGQPFLGLTPCKPLKIFYLQAEVQYYYLRERIQLMQLSPSLQRKAGDNLLITPQLKLLLNEAGCHQVLAAARSHKAFQVPDLLVVDPIRNVFDGGPEGNSENDNNAMLFFLQQRVEALRDALNPDAGIILVHHTRKITKHQLLEDPFMAFSGAGSLRSYYTTGMLLYRADEALNERRLEFELRNGKALKSKLVDKVDGQWIELEHQEQRLANQQQGLKQDAERQRKADTIVQIIQDEALRGHIYTINQFAEAFEGKAGLGSNRTITERIAVHATKGNIKFMREPEAYGLPKLSRTKYGYLCVEGMQLASEGTINTETGELLVPLTPVKPTHYKCPLSGAVLPVENPDVWVYQEETPT